MRRSLLSVIAFLFLVGSAFGQNKISDNQLALEVEAMTVTNLSGQTIKIPGYKLLGDPKTLEFKQLRAEEEAKRAKLIKQAMNSTEYRRPEAQPMYPASTVGFTDSLDRCNRCSGCSQCNNCQPNCQPSCRTNCQPSCRPNCQPACRPNCQPNCRTNCRPNCQPSCRGNCCGAQTGVPAQGYFCNCPAHIARCEENQRAGRDPRPWWLVPCTCPGMNGGGSGSCCDTN